MEVQGAADYLPPVHGAAPTEDCLVPNCKIVLKLRNSALNEFSGLCNPEPPSRFQGQQERPLTNARRCVCSYVPTSVQPLHPLAPPNAHRFPKQDKWGKKPKPCSRRVVLFPRRALNFCGWSTGSDLADKPILWG